MVFFAQNMGKNISRNLNEKYSQKLLDLLKQYATDALETTSVKVIQKTAEASGDLTDNKIVNRIKKVSRSSLQNNLETITNEHAKEIPKERHISPEKRQNIIDDLRLIS